jgi:hypothetical protein
MQKHAYAAAVWCETFVLILLFGNDLPKATVPALLILSSTQWLLLLPRFGWRAAVFSTMASGTILTAVFQVCAAREQRSLGVSLALIGLTVQLLLLYLAVSGSSARGIITVHSLMVALLLSLTAYVGPILGHVHLALERILITPLLALSLWIAGVQYGWRKHAQIVFIILFVQTAIGFIDVGAFIQTKWMYGCALLCMLLALAFVIGWAKSLNE